MEAKMVLMDGSLREIHKNMESIKGHGNLQGDPDQPALPSNRPAHHQPQPLHVPGLLGASSTWTTTLL
eukprot:6076672-Prorocentrum_lima.AAC.1